MKKILAVLAVGMISSMAHAATVGSQSYKDNIEVGGSMWIPFGPHADSAGLPGVGVKGVALGQLSKISMRSVRKLTEQNPDYGATDGNNVTVVTPPAHGKVAMGNFNFAQLADSNAEVYYGEWTAHNDTAGATRSVYYVGKDKTANMPTSGTATYAVKGINQYSGNNQLNGTFTADFGKNTLKGSLANNALNVGVDAKINTAAASFNGSATAAGKTGTSQGHFFGNNAGSLAGFAKFDDRKLDTAFGGVKK
ncbi:transferrin-binding protein-like solute binding protein [Uruburuella testudinis]|uniref:Transferrin-binding protein-like solute binding protein n=1 Tax=Uruburuella testudinis TaxID=1282863 RepID=A0ABY4DQF4_9NEIS|nr:Slam-dependent surface lipoprotein [Uruburuella testudinis]UOO80940.1 transferrin-binding protein-like solute binding protein [Uruburuella testudinis]